MALNVKHSKILLFAVLFIVAGCSYDERLAESQKQNIAASTGNAVTNGFDAVFIEALPGCRKEALKKAEPTAEDSFGDCYDKRAAYFSTLTNIIQEIRSRYYFHSDFPTNLCAALEQHAEVLAGIQYPLSATTGNSGYAALLIDKKIELAEDMICQMVQAIFETAYWENGKSCPTKRGNTLYHTWLKKWKSGSAY